MFYAMCIALYNLALITRIVQFIIIGIKNVLIIESYRLRDFSASYCSYFMHIRGSFRYWEC